MTVIDILHKLILGPIELLFDVIFALSMQAKGSPVLSIVVLSIAINILVLPLYKKADALQREEQELEKRLKPRIDQIREAFTGDERFMMLQTFYRQNNYKPYYVLRGSLSLLLQIPFFMVAYNFLSNLTVLQGVSFGSIANLAAPDGMLKIGGTAINVLPILMTLINIVSGMIYTRGMPLKSKVQLYGMALIFLVLLYNSPAGLVFYWTLNNVFSLLKNIVEKLFRKRRAPEKAKKPAKPENRHLRGAFFGAVILLTILTGLLIPSAVIHASPAEFVEMDAFRNPLSFVFSAFLLAAGTFLLWCVIYYLLSDRKRRSLYALIFGALALAALVNYMFFGNNYGNMSAILVYDRDIAQSVKSSQKLINLVVILALCGAVFVLWKKKPVVLRTVTALACLVTFGMSAVNLVSVGTRLPEIRRLADQSRQSEDKIIHLDKSGKNVVVIMLDRAIGYFAPFIFEEKPQLKEQFAGFTCYPNTLSYGNGTNTGTPALFGGYEYTMDKINARAEELLVDKHNEALRLMPLLFHDAGFEVTVCDPPLANYQWIADLSIFDDVPDIRTFITEGRVFDDTTFSGESRNAVRDRNMFCYSLLRIAPVAVHSVLYDGGNYNKTEKQLSFENSLFMSQYTFLKNLESVTKVGESGQNEFLVLVNSLTHEPMELQEPAYEPAEYVDNAKYDAEHPTRVSGDGRTMTLSTQMQREAYQANVAALLLLGNWMDSLREQGVYDNTRIIIASDHGTNLDFEDLEVKHLGISTMMFNPLYMVKDFGEEKPFAFSDEFMIHADTPTLAFEGFIENPVNPATGNPVTDADKQKDAQVVGASDWNVEENNGTTFKDTSYCVLRNHDLRVPENWSGE